MFLYFYLNLLIRSLNSSSDFMVNQSFINDDDKLTKNDLKEYKVKNE